MRIEEEGLSRSLQLEHEILHHLPSDRIESAHWFIEKYNLRIMQDRLSKSDTLEHSFRVGMELLRSRMYESDFLENFIFSLIEFCSFESIEGSIEVEEFIS